MLAWRSPILIGLLYFCAAVPALALTRFDGGIAFLWVATAILIAHLSDRSTADWWRSLLAAAIASALATGLVGLGWTLALPLAAINMAEAAIAAYMLQSQRSAIRPLGSPEWLAKFVLAVGIVAPALAAILAGLALVPSGRAFTATVAVFFPAHALGNLIFAPIALLLTRGDVAVTARRLVRRDWLETGLLFLFGCGLTALAFAQNAWPLLFLPILPLILATVRLGRIGAAVGIVAIALIGGAFTMLGRGPILLVDGGAAAQLLFFQFYLAATVTMALLVSAELSQRARLARRMRISSEKFRLMADHSTDILFHFETDGRIRYVSPSIMRLAGYDPQQLIGRNAMVLVAPEQHEVTGAAFLETLALRGETKTHDFRMVTADGSSRWFETHARAVIDEDGSIDGMVSFVRDISDRKANEERLVEEAMTDPLTGLANRRAFRAAVESAGNGKTNCLAVLDLDHFKRINDEFGHECGDEVLRSFATLARSMVRGHDLVARVGGEEFAIFFPGATSEQALAICERLRGELARTPIAAGGAQVTVTISGGVAALGEGGIDAAFAVADQALYRAKRNGRDQLALAA